MRENSHSEIFRDRYVLSDSYVPDVILHRDEEINKIYILLANSILKEFPQNIFIYGKSGTGKTLTIKHVMKKLLNEKNLKDLFIYCYINCKNIQTRYRILAEILKSFKIPVPSSGWSSEKLYIMLKDILENSKKFLILILDEIDEILKKRNDNILYTLSRLNSEIKHSRIILVGISNNISFMSKLDPRISNSLFGTNIIFNPYNAEELKDILYFRSKLAFNNDVIENGAIEYLAAYVARESGDVRKALKILKFAGEIAERNGLKKVTIDCIKDAIKKLETNVYEEIIKNLPLHYKLILYSLAILKEENNMVTTGTLYNLYERICRILNMECLSQKRVSEIISELESMGILSSRILNRGRYGRTREIWLNIPDAKNLILNCIKISLGEICGKTYIKKIT